MKPIPRIGSHLDADFWHVDLQRQEAALFNLRQMCNRSASEPRFTTLALAINAIEHEIDRVKQFIRDEEKAAK